MPDSIKFTELPSGTLGANSIFATAEEAGGGAYASTKINTANLGNYLTGVLQYAGINTEDKTVEGALNELLTYASNIADEYDSTATYDVDDFVIHSGVLYKCITAITTPEAWTSAHWTSTLVVDNFGSGGASVTLGTTVPLDASGENGDLYVQYEALTYKVVEYFVKINGSWRKAPYSRVIALTQAEYDLITPDPTTLYIITDAQSGYVQLPVITDAYDATSTYDVGDLCIYNDALYKCTTAITVAEAWTPAHWTQTSIADEIGRITEITAGTITPDTGIDLSSVNAILETINGVTDISISLGTNGTATLARWGNTKICSLSKPPRNIQRYLSRIRLGPNDWFSVLVQLDTNGDLYVFDTFGVTAGTITGFFFSATYLS